jgi:hypothetical protein
MDTQDVQEDSPSDSSKRLVGLNIIPKKSDRLQNFDGIQPVFEIDYWQFLRNLQSILQRFRDRQ